MISSISDHKTAQDREVSIPNRVQNPLPACSVRDWSGRGTALSSLRSISLTEDVTMNADIKAPSSVSGLS
jgi:hypothetical protein